jgi:hypothetical protein
VSRRRFTWAEAWDEARQAEAVPDDVFGPLIDMLRTVRLVVFGRKE